MGGYASGGNKVIDSGLKIYNMVEDNKQLRRNYNHEQQMLLAEQRQNRQNKTNILEKNLANRRARVAAMGISGDGSAAVGQYQMAYEGQRNMAIDDYNYYNRSLQRRRNARYTTRKNLVNGIGEATQSLLS